MLNDLRYAVRMLLKSPGFTAVAVVTLSLGIGANTAFFSLSNALLLRSLPVSRPGELVRMCYAQPAREFGLSGPIFDELRRRQSVFSGMLAWHTESLTLTEGGESRSIAAAYASGEAFSVLGVQPYAGRMLAPADDAKGGGSSGWAAVLSYGYWTSHYGGDRLVLGRTIVLEHTPVTIVGVMPAKFEGVEVGADPQVVVPLQFVDVTDAKRREHPTSMWLTVVGRLKPGASLRDAETQTAQLSPAIIQDVDKNRLLSKGFFAGGQIAAFPGRTGRSFLRAEFREPLLALDAIVMALLLIGCANLAGLLSARAVQRRHELAIRAALGSKRAQLVRQLFVEALVLCLIGGLAALLTASFFSEALLSMLLPRAGQSLPLHLDLSLDVNVLVFTFGIALLTALLVSLPAGLRATRAEVLADLKSGPQTIGPQRRFEGWLIPGQVALSVVLLVCASLLVGTLYRLLRTEPGFRTEGTLLVPTDLTRLPEKGAQRVQLYERMLERLSAVPGIEAASLEAIPPLSGWTTSTYYASVLPDGSLRVHENLSYNEVGPHYFAATGTRVLAGRDFLASDRDSRRQTCVLNRSAAAFFFPDGNAVGATVRERWNGKLGDACQIVGVVEDTKYSSLRAPAMPTIYWTFMESANPGASYWLVLRTSEVATAAAAARDVQRELAPGTPLLTPVPVGELLTASIGRERTLAALALGFALLGLLMTAVGLYALLSFQVAQRTREIGIRIALGADRPQVVSAVLARSLALTAAGVGLGLLLSFAATRLLGNLLFEIRPADPVAFTAAALALLAIATLASYLPARRATRVDPMVALRYE